MSNRKLEPTPLIRLPKLYLTENYYKKPKLCKDFMHNELQLGKYDEWYELISDCAKTNYGLTVNGYTAFVDDFLKLLFSKANSKYVMLDISKLLELLPYAYKTAKQCKQALHSAICLYKKQYAKTILTDIQNITKLDGGFLIQNCNRLLQDDVPYNSTTKALFDLVGQAWISGVFSRHENKSEITEEIVNTMGGIIDLFYDNIPQQLVINKLKNSNIIIIDTINEMPYKVLAVMNVEEACDVVGYVANSNLFYNNAHNKQIEILSELLATMYTSVGVSYEEVINNSGFIGKHILYSSHVLCNRYVPSSMEFVIPNNYIRVSSRYF